MKGSVEFGVWTSVLERISIGLCDLWVAYSPSHETRNGVLNLNQVALTRHNGDTRRAATLWPCHSGAISSPMVVIKHVAVGLLQKIGVFARMGLSLWCQ